jgi:hypothetical protein
MPSNLEFVTLAQGEHPILNKKRGAKCAFLGKNPESGSMMILSSTDEEDASDHILVPTLPICSESLAGASAVIQFAEAQNPFNKGVVFIRKSLEIGAVALEEHPQVEEVTASTGMSEDILTHAARKIADISQRWGPHLTSFEREKEIVPVLREFHPQMTTTYEEGITEVEHQPSFVEASFVRLPMPVLSRQQARRLQIFPVDVNNLPEEAEGDDWDLKMNAGRVFQKSPSFHDPSFVDESADRSMS